jgi:hypothetical protein
MEGVWWCCLSVTMGMVVACGDVEAIVDAAPIDGSRTETDRGGPPEPDAGRPPDGGTVADAAGDGGVSVPDGSPPLLSERIVIAAASLDELWLHDAASLAAGGTVPLPDRTGTGSSRIDIDGGTIWIASTSDLHAVDLVTLAGKAGYPRAFDPVTQCTTNAALLVGGAMVCRFDPTGTASDVVQRWSGDPPALVATSPNLPSPLRAGGSATRVLVSYGTSDDTIAVLDATLTPLAGSPLTASAGPVFTMEVDDTASRIAIAAGASVELFDRATLASIGSRAFPANVAGLAFDAASDRVIVTLSDGRVASHRASDLAEVVAPVSRATESIYQPIVDASRGRVIALTSTRLVVLDAITLDHVGASPVILPSAPADVAVH